MRSVVLATLVLSGCSSLVPTTIMKLNQVDPLTADPAGFAVAMDLPAGIDVLPQTAFLSFGVKRSDSGETAEGSFILQRSEGAQTVYQIDRRDHADLRALQTTARTWKADNSSATMGSLAVTLSPCKRGQGPAQDARVNIAIRMVENGPFLPLVRNGPLSAVTEQAEISTIPTCP